MEIFIKSDSMSSHQLKDQIQQSLGEHNESIKFELRKPKYNFKGIDPSILVAIISSSGTILAAFISVILQKKLTQSDKKICIKTPEWKIEVDGNISSEELEKLIKELEEQNAEKIDILLSKPKTMK